MCNMWMNLISIMLNTQLEKSMFIFIENFKIGKLIYGHRIQESGYLWGEERTSYLEGHEWGLVCSIS